jgi:hypothetical protein
MVLKCLLCGLVFRNRNELDWHVRQDHPRSRPRPAASALDHPAPQVAPVEDEVAVRATALLPRQEAHWQPR